MDGELLEVRNEPDTYLHIMTALWKVAVHGEKQFSMGKASFLQAIV